MDGHVGDTKLADELVSLRSAFNESIRDSKSTKSLMQEEMRELRSRNDELESELSKKVDDKQLKRQFSLRRSSSTIQKMMPANQDAYSFLFCSANCSIPSMLGFLVVVVQVSLFSLFVGNLITSSRIPPGVDIVVQVTQAIAIMVSFLAANDVRISIRALIYQDGVEEMEEQFKYFTKNRFLVANACMFAQGMLGQVVTIFLIIYSDNVFDLLLNFCSVLFVSELDELV